MVPGLARRLRRLDAAAAPPQPGKVIGPSFAADEVPDVIEAVLDTYRGERAPRASASSTPSSGVGIEPFKAAANAVRRSTRRAVHA